MDTPVPAKHADVASTGRTGNTRSKSIKLPRSERLHDDIEHGITLWAGPKAIITAYLPKVDPDDLQIAINETSLILNGSALSMITQKTRRHAGHGINRNASASPLNRLSELHQSPWKSRRKMD